MAFLRRIDEPKVLIQQAVYILISCVLLTIDLSDHLKETPPPAWLSRVWKYREFLLHFLLGTLLNSYTIFYFKSASGITSFIFIFILVAALTLSEFKRFGESQIKVHMGLWSLCLISYLQSLLPIIFGAVGNLLFLVSGLASIGVFAIYYRILRVKYPEHREWLKRQVLYPYALIQLIFTILYFSHAIPPVPLSVSYLGIFHGAEKKEGQYFLTYTRPQYKFWQHGDEGFEARPGDTIIAFVQVFLPSRFQEELRVKWSLYDEKRGWQLQDTVPLIFTGGREAGFRAVVTKNHYQDGLWRIQIETEDSREIGRLSFSVTTDNTTDERNFKTEIR